ncbi:hypothetical protein C7C46_01100 [Streptomyces tateyamensis]|uniref:Uncharacterized protein n=1 Tax=Streptomyces tateyamensis TaxID=565073 RepID=A0A2V4P110_9ACTN|nr:hypothetical protein C7C46_01100 [Streptomyces tateyamensis]
MDQDAVMRAKVLLLGANRRVVRGPRGLSAYRVLTGVNPEVYGSKLVKVLVEAGRSPRVAELPQARVALLEEAVAVARGLSPANPYRARMLALAVAALDEEQGASETS